MVVEKEPVKKYPLVGVCGLDCGLCPRHHTQGESRCPGCCGEGFRNVAPGCSRITCCVKGRKLEACAQCADWAGCGKIARSLNAKMDSFISYQTLRANFAFIQEHGIEEFARLEAERKKLLIHLLDSNNDGRAKLFYCTACQLLPFHKLKDAVREAKVKMPEDADIKEKARIIRAAISELANSLGIEVKLRK